MLLQADLTAALPVWGWFVILVVGALAGAWVAQRIVIRMLRRLTKRTNTRIDDMVLRAIAPSLTLAFFVGGTWIGLQYIPYAFSELTTEIIDNVAAILIILAVAMAVARLIGGLLSIPAQREPRWQAASAVGTRILNVAVYAVALVMVLDHLHQPITPLVASLGIAALAVALALQDTLANFFAGVWIQAGRTLQPGHLVEFEDPKIMGFVREVGWRTTKIHTLPNNIVVIPNKAVAEATITDYDMPEPRMGSNMIVRAAFESDPEEVERILLASVHTVAKEKPDLGILDDPAPATRLNGFGDYGFEFWLGFQCRDWFAQWNGGGAIRKEIARRFLEAGIRMPYPIREQVQVPPDRLDFAKGLARGSYARATPAPASEAASSPSETPEAAAEAGEA